MIQSKHVHSDLATQLINPTDSTMFVDSIISMILIQNFLLTPVAELIKNCCRWPSASRKRTGQASGIRACTAGGQDTGTGGVAVPAVTITGTVSIIK